MLYIIFDKIELFAYFSFIIDGKMLVDIADESA